MQKSAFFRTLGFRVTLFDIAGANANGTLYEVVATEIMRLDLHIDFSKIKSFNVRHRPSEMELDELQQLGEIVELSDCIDPKNLDSIEVLHPTSAFKVNNCDREKFENLRKQFVGRFCNGTTFVPLSTSYF